MLINDGLSVMFNALFMAFLMSSRVLHINPFCSFPLNMDMSFSYLIEGNRAVGGHDVDGFPSTMSVYISSSNPLWVYKRRDKFANGSMAIFFNIIDLSLIILLHSILTYILSQLTSFRYVEYQNVI